MELSVIKNNLKGMLIKRLDIPMDPENIENDKPLFGYDDEGNGLGLDSIDILEIVVGIKQLFGLEMKASEQTAVFATVNSLSEYIYKETSK